MRLKILALVPVLLSGCATLPPAPPATAVPLAPVAGNPFQSPIVTTEIGHGHYQLSSGSNAVLAVGRDGAILVDTLFFNPDKLAETVKGLTPLPVRYVVSTHAHRDHTGGNETFARMGAVVVSTVAAAQRMAEPSTNTRGEVQPPIAAAGRPTRTLAQRTTLSIPGQRLEFIPVGASHTDGDAMVFFPDANVLILGDLHHSHEYPVYDAQSGCKCGSYEGNLQVYRQALRMTNPATRIVAGHGGLTTKAELEQYVRMLEDTRTKVQALITQGKTKEEVVAAKLLADDRSVQPGGPQNADAFIGTLYTALKTGEGA